MTRIDFVIKVMVVNFSKRYRFILVCTGRMCSIDKEWSTLKARRPRVVKIFCLGGNFRKEALNIARTVPLFFSRKCFDYNTNAV